jgi:hypothetical protein
MEKSLAQPIKIEFAGYDADSHKMDAVLLGKSLSGLGRLYNGVGHFHFNQEIRSAAHSDVKVQIGPPEQGSIFYLLYVLMVHGRMAVYPEILFELVELAIPTLVRAIIAKKTGQTNELQKCLEIIQKQNEMIENQNIRSHELALSAQQASDKREDRYLSVIEKLTEINRKPLADLAAPVGKTVRSLTQKPRDAEPIFIDSPTAESLRSPEQITVGSVTQMAGSITALDTTNGHFKFLESTSNVEYRGNITDPALKVPQNIYSHALDTKKEICLVAKPTIRENGEIHKLFASDAMNIG